MKTSKVIQTILKDENFLNNRASVNLVQDYVTHLYKSLDMKTILKDKTFLKKEKHAINSIKLEYVEHLSRTAKPMKPKSKIRMNYVGIEVECFTRNDWFDLTEKLIQLDLHKMVQLVDDGSIEPDFGDPLEMRILVPEKKLSETLKKLNKLFVKNEFGINWSCGLHIHLDMRNRDVEKCYNKLLKCQDVLFGMVDRERWGSEYCEYAIPKLNAHSRYVAINKTAYQTHKTIEVRLHQATLDMKRIEQWIQLLLKVIGNQTPPTIETKADVLQWAKKQKGLSSYITKNFNEKWFERKKKVASGEYDDDYNGEQE
jgi:hypothetical protein